MSGPKVVFPKDKLELRRLLILRTHYFSLILAVAVLVSFNILIDYTTTLYEYCVNGDQMEFWRGLSLLGTLIYDAALAVLVHFSFSSKSRAWPLVAFCGFALYSVEKVLNLVTWTYNDVKYCSSENVLDCFTQSNQRLMTVEAAVAVSSLLCAFLCSAAVISFCPLIQVIVQMESEQGLINDLLSYRRQPNYTGYTMNGKIDSNLPIPPGTTVSALLVSQKNTTAVVTDDADVFTGTSTSTKFGSGVTHPDGKSTMRLFHVDDDGKAMPARIVERDSTGSITKTTIESEISE